MLELGQVMDASLRRLNDQVGGTSWGDTYDRLVLPIDAGVYDPVGGEVTRALEKEVYQSLWSKTIGT
jgi:hypothetical protein